MFKADGDQEEFWENRPSVNNRQRSLLCCYYRARRDTHGDERIKRKDLLEAAEAIDYESDFAATIMQNLDDYYLKLRLEDLKRKQKNGR